MKQLFGLTMIVLAGFFLWRIWNIHPMYVDGSVRAQIQKTLEDVANREGWLLSNVELKKVSSKDIRLIYREHRKGKDPEKCHVIQLSDSSLKPCA